MLLLTGPDAEESLTRQRRSSGGASAGTDGLLTWAMRGSSTKPDSPDSDPSRAPKPAGPDIDQVQAWASKSPGRGTPRC